MQGWFIDGGLRIIMKFDMERKVASQELICIELNDAADDFLIGMIEACDEEGILILNIDYRGIATGHIYLHDDRVEGIIDEPYYVSRVKILQKSRENAEHLRTFSQNENIREQFLKWVYKEHEMIQIEFPDEQLQGFICGIEEDYIVLEIVDEITGKRNGYSAIYKDKLLYMIQRIAN